MDWFVYTPPILCKLATIKPINGVTSTQKNTPHSKDYFL